MPQDSSFDVRYTPNIAEVDNAWNQALKELAQRYDFKGVPTTLELDKKTFTFTLQTGDEMKLKNLLDILERRLVGRGIMPAAQEVGAVEAAGGGTVKQTVKIQQGIPEDKIKKITEAVKALGLKVRTQIQGSEIRVFAKAKDDLQTVIAALKSQNFGCAVEFGNYR